MADFFTPSADRALEEANAAVETAKSKSILPTPSAPPQAAQLDPTLVRDFEAAAIKHNVPVDVLMAMAEKDSGFDPLSRSRGPGAKTRGIIKTSDEDVAKNPGANPYVASHSIDIAAGKLRGLLDSGKSLSDALKSIASGPSPDQWGPDASEYADDILARSQRLLDTYEQQQPAPAAPPAAPATPQERPGVIAQAGGDIVRGVKQLKNTGIGLAALGASAAGFDSWADDLLKSYVANEKDIQENNAPVVGSYKNVHSFGDAGRYAVEAIFENLPMMAGTMGAGAIGGAVARKIAQRAVADMVEKQVAEGVAKSVAEKNVADYVARRTVAGAAAGAYAGSAGMESGSIMGDIYRETGQKRPGIAAGFGAVAGALDAIEPVMAISKVVGPAAKDAVVGGLVKRLGVEGAKQFATEAGTEGLQTIIEKAATTATDGRQLFTPQLLDEVIDSVLKGGIAGGVTGVGSQAAHEALNRGAQEEPVDAPAAEPPRDASAMAAQPSPSPSPAPATPVNKGPLSRVMEAAAPGVAPLSDIAGKRVVVTDEAGQMAGHIVGQDADGVIFKGDDGQEQLIDHGDLSSGSVTIAPASDAPTQEAPRPAPQPESGPSAENVAEAMEPEKPSESDLSEQASAKAPTTRAPDRALEEMSEPELRERMKYIAGQAKASNGWNATLMQARRKVEAEIERRKVDSQEGNSDVQEQPSNGLRVSDVGKGGAQAGKRGVSDSKGASKSAAFVNEVGRDGSAGTSSVGADNLVRPTGLAESKPSLTEEQAKAADYAARNWWGARTAAQSFLRTKGLEDTHEVKQTGERKFHIVPKSEVKFTDESGTLGVPREEMPQVKSEHHGALVNHLNAKGIAHETTEVPAADLKPTQAEFSPEKVEKAKEATGDRSVIVSSDGHIIDGHHQAIAAAEQGENVKAIVLDAPVKEALEAVKAAPMATTAAEQKAEPAAAATNVKWFGNREKAQAFIDKKSLGDTHEIKQKGKYRFEIVEKDTTNALKEGAKEEDSKRDHQGGNGVGEDASRGDSNSRPQAVGGKPEKQEEVKAKEATKRPSPEKSDWSEVGKNEIGQTLYQDQRGVRSYIENGVRHTEPVGLRPTRAGMEISTNRDLNTEYRTAEEVAAEKPSPKTSDHVLEEPENESVGSKNTVFTEDAYKAARERFKKRHNGTQFNEGVDPADMMDGIVMAGYHIERGARTFAAFAKAMVDDLGDNIRPYLKSWYLGAKFDPRAAQFDGMSGAADVESADIDAILSESKANEPAKLDEPSESPLAGVPTDEVQGTEEERDAASGATGSGGEDVSGDGVADGTGLHGTRSLGDGEAGVSVPAGGSSAEGEERQRAGSERGGEAVQRDRGTEDRDSEGRGRDREPSAGIPASNSPSDFAIGEEDRIGEGGAKTKFRQNVAAIRLLRQLESDGRPATREEQSVLAKWVGWGGLPQAFERSDKTASKGWEKEVAELRELLTPEEMSAAEASTRNAHFTSPEIVKAMWDAMRHMGFTQGRVLEPSVGAGNFFGLMPADMRAASHLYGVELDHITGGIAKNLYPAAAIAAPVGFQEFTITDGYFDAVIGNPPFGSEKLYDPLRKDLSKFSIHNYFFAKSLDGLKPGGVMAMVVTNRFMDGVNDEARQYIAERADLVAAIRLPNNAFLNNAGTEVTTDIVILRKRHPGESEGQNYWGEVIDFTDKNGDKVPLNEYFSRHPENMLGEFGNFGTMYAGRGRGDVESALVAREGQDTAKLLADAVARLPRGITSGSAHAAAPESIPVTAGLAHVRVGSMFLQDGKVFVRQEDSLGEPRAATVDFPSEKAAERVHGMISVRDHFADLRRLQLDPVADDRRIEAARERLNAVYDAFVNKNGYINSDANKRLFRDDPSWPQISALEDDYDKGVSAAVEKTTGEKRRAPSAAKAAVFSRRTQSPYSPPTHADSAKDALVSSLAERGRVDLDLMERLYGKSKEEILSELGNLVFGDPVRGTVTRDEYLSGNVKKKLAEAEQAAKKDAAYQRNVEALKEVQPADIPAAQIDVKPGAHWIPRNVMIAFVQHIAGGRQSDAFYNPESGKWTITATASDDAMVRWGTDRARVAEVIQAAASQKAMVIYDRNPDDTRTVNEKATEAANAKVAAVTEEWERWIFEDDDRRASLSRLYNDMFNTDVKRHFDGSHLTFPGKVGDDIITLRPHQKNAIWRILQSPTTLLDHVVGAGKTFTIIGAVMEGKRMGLMQKPVLVVPNHLVEQWASDFIRLYPSANILAATKNDFEKANRKRLFARIATGDWDAVIVAHSSFGKVEVDPESQVEFIEKQVADLIKTEEQVRAAEGKAGRNVKQVQESIAKKREKIKKLLDVGRKDDSLYFGELGLDAIFVDEAHEFKNLEYSTSMTRVAGLGSQKGSQKASDLYLKVDQVLKVTGGRNITFATGTPISNTMAEMFTMQRYLDGKRLEEQGLSHFDAWARMYGEIVNAFEISPAGKYKMNSRFAKFSNLPELMQSYTGFADVINRDDINAQLAAHGKKLPVPKMKGGKPQNIVVERSAAQADYIGVSAKDAEGNDTDVYPEGSLIWRADNLPKRPEKGGDNMLKIMSDARKAALDMRLIDPSYPDHPGSKVNDAANRIKALYDKWHADKGTQLVFIDLSTPKNALAKEARELRELIEKAEAGDEAAQEKLDAKSQDEFLALESKFSVYDDLKEKLISKGIPENEIEFIHSANTDKQKADLFNKVRSGLIRVLLGSTAKMGAGTNVQDLLVALHHLDAPWRPSDLEQREGRIIRQGNKLYERDPEGFEVEVNRYATKQTPDSSMWQTIEGKARFIEQIRKGSGERSIEDVGGEAMNSAEMKAASSGNPLIFTAMELEQKIRKLSNEEYNFRQEQYRVRDVIRWNNSLISDYTTRVADMKSDLETETPKEFAMNVRGETFKKRAGAGKRILEEAKSMADDGRTLVGSYGGFKLTLERANSTFGILVNGVGTYETSRFTLTDDEQGVAQRVLNAIPGPARIRSLEGQIEDAKKTIDSLKTQVGEWPKREELAKVKADHAEIVEKLKAKPKPAPAATEEGEAKASVGTGVGNMTAKALREHLTRGADGQLIGKMLASGRITVHDDESTLPGSPPKGTQGATMPDGTIHLVASNLTPENARAVLLHEAFHAGGESLTGAHGWKTLMERVRLAVARAEERGDPEGFWRDALDQARASGGPLAEEVAAYAIENHEQAPAGLRDIADRFIGMAKAWALRTFGRQFGDVTPAQLRAIAVAALRSSVSPNPTTDGPGGVRYSIASPRKIASGLFGKMDEALSDFITNAMVSPSAQPSDTGRNSILAAAPVRGLFLEVAKGLPSARHYIDTKTAMDAFRNQKAQETDAILQRWFKYANTVKMDGAVPKLINRGENTRLMDLMHETTIAGVDPSKAWEGQSEMTPADRDELRRGRAGSKAHEIASERQARGSERKKQWDAFKTRYDALSADAKVIYNEVRDAYREMADESEQLVLENMKRAVDASIKKAERAHDDEMRRVADEGLTGKERDDAIEAADKKLTMAKTRAKRNKAARLKRMREEFEKNRVQEPYFPLSRFGSYWVTVRDAENKVVSFSRFESAGDQRRFADEMRADSDMKVEVGVAKVEADYQKAIDPQFMANLDAILENADVAHEVRDQVWQRYLESLPDLSIRKHRIHRKGRAGFNADALRAFAHVMFHGGHQMARLKYGIDLQEYLDQIAKEVEGTKNPVRSGAVYNEMVKAHEFSMNPAGASWSHRISSMAFLWTMAFNVSSALVNVEQTWSKGAPVLAFDSDIKAGNKKAFASLARATRDFMIGKGFVENASTLTDEERRAIHTGYELGAIDRTQAHDLAAISESGVTYNPIINNVMKAAAWPMHQTERFNREITFLAAYRLSRQAGMTHQKAIGKAADLTWMSHYDNQGASKPRLMRGDWQRIFFALKGFQANVLFRVFWDAHEALKGEDKEARKLAVGRLATTIALSIPMAGLSGAFAMHTLMAIAAFFMGMAGSDDDPEEELRRIVLNMTGDSIVGRAVGGMIMEGAPGYITGTALSDRIGTADLWFRSNNRDMTPEQKWMYLLEQAGGAPLGLAHQVYQGASEMGKGNIARGVEKMLPAAAKNVAKAVRYAMEGVADKDGNPIVEYVPVQDIAKQALGFTPAEIKERMDRNAFQTNTQKRITGEVSAARREAARAHISGDQAAMAEAEKKVDAVNEKYPEIWIKPKSIMQTARGMESRKDRLDFGVDLNPKLEDRIKGATSPSIYRR